MDKNKKVQAAMARMAEEHAAALKARPSLVERLGGIGALREGFQRMAETQSMEQERARSQAAVEDARMAAADERWALEKLRESSQAERQELQGDIERLRLERENERLRGELDDAETQRQERLRDYEAWATGEKDRLLQELHAMDPEWGAAVEECLQEIGQT